MDISLACLDIRNKYKNERWFHSIGVGGHDHTPVILLYVKKSRLEIQDMFSEGWMGHIVIVRHHR